MLVDDVKIIIKAGDGGDGAATFKRNAQTAKGGPDGGNGGNGGNVYAVGTTDESDLRRFMYQKVAKAENGIKGGHQNLYGRNGHDLVIPLPVGTRITERETQTVYEITDTTTQVLLARGGNGGRGNNEFKSATNQTPKYAEKGHAGEEKRVHLELRLIAEVGLIGIPNAGKSSLLEVLTNATPKVGNYPFTTLEPNLGVMEKIVLADIPGLIEGASTGKGLGITFLKHIEKTRLLVHCIDSTEKDIEKIYNTIREEFRAYSAELLEKPEIILLTKTDLVTPKELEEKTTMCRKLRKDVLTVSIYNPTDLNALKNSIKEYLDIFRGIPSKPENLS